MANDNQTEPQPQSSADGPVTEPARSSDDGKPPAPKNVAHQKPSNGPIPPAGYASPSPTNNTSNDGNPLPPNQQPSSSNSTAFDLSSLPQSDIEALVRARKLAMVACIGSAISFIIGGVLLSGICLVAGIMSYLRYSSVSAHLQDMKDVATVYKRMGIVAIALPAVALAINFVAIMMVFPLVLEASETGNLDALFGASGTEATGGGSTSTWG